LKIQDLQHMGADVDELAHGGGNGRRSRSVEGVEILSSRGVGGRRARSHGVRIGSRLSSYHKRDGESIGSCIHYLSIGFIHVHRQHAWPSEADSESVPKTRR
jgi:hypothetical protein